MQIGYASGFTTEFMGRPVLYREVECQSMRKAHCRIVGRTVEEWGDEAAQDMRYLGPRNSATAARASATFRRRAVVSRMSAATHTRPPSASRPRRGASNPGWN
jgi:two-component system, NtrC family, response regulator HydG